jgi:hypothetical protein
VTSRRAAGLAGTGSVVAFLVAFFLRMNAAYGPFNLSVDPADWTVLWELWRHGQIAAAVVAQGAALGVAAALLPWVALRLLSRRRPR